MGARLFGSGNGAAPTPTVQSTTRETPALPPPPPAVLRHPPSALVELGVLSERSESELEELVGRAALAALIGPAQCGDEAACAAVRGALSDEHTTTLQIVPATNWNIGDVDLDASAPGLSPVARASVKKRARIAVIHVATATSTRQLAVRAAFAAAAAIAEKIDGLVYDQLLGRIESAHDFGARAVTTAIDGTAFRGDRIDLLYEPKGPGVVRILTAGLSRWGAPDVEAAAVPTAAGGRIADIVLGVAEALANGASSGPVTLGRDDLARVRGTPYHDDSDLPPSTPIGIDLASVPPEGGDPNDFIARIVPPGGTEPLGYLDLAERFFGPTLGASPDEAALRASRERAQRALPSALARWSAAASAGRTLFVQLPFEIAGDAGVESMWVDVTRYDAHNVTGRIVDDPLGATQFNRGDEVTRPRADVEDLDSREGRDR